MPLPVSGGAWPPPHMQFVLGKWAPWAAWYSGDPNELARVYEGTPYSTSTYSMPPGSTAAEFFKPSTYRGGLVGKVARWFWGTPPTPGEQRTKVHVPAAGRLATLSADVLFGDPLILKAAPGAAQDDTQARLDAYAVDGLQNVLRSAAEVAAAFGGVYLRACWDTDVADAPFTTFVQPDAAVPEWVHGRLRAVTFWRDVHVEDSTVWRHLERHEPGAIMHGLYEGTREELGRRVPLTEHHTTAPIAAALTDGDTIVTGVPSLTASYIPNMTPNRWTRRPDAAHHGRSDFDGIETLFDSLDETWSSLMRDIRLGKARLVVNSAVLESAGPGQGGVLDLDREVLMPLRLGPGGASDGTGLTMAQFAIRTAEHLETARALVEQIVGAAGYALMSYAGSGDAPAATATEVASRERATHVTRGKKIDLWRPAITAHLRTLLAIDAAVFGATVNAADRPTVEFTPAVSADPSAVARELVDLSAAGAISTVEKVRRRQPQWTDEQVAEEAARIAAEATAGTGTP